MRTPNIRTIFDNIGKKYYIYEYNKIPKEIRKSYTSIKMKIKQQLIQQITNHK